MKGKLPLLFLILIIFSCSKKDKYTQRIQTFEEIIGPDIANALDRMVEYLDTFVVNQTKIGNLDSAYHSFLTQVRDGTLILSPSMLDSATHNELIQLYTTSGLYNDMFLKKQFIDVNEELQIRYRLYLPDSTLSDTLTTQFLLTDDLINKKDSLVQAQMSTPDYNYSNRYVTGLYAVSEGDSLIISYLDAKYVLERINPSLVAGGLLVHNPDFSDYFVKRILALELLL